MYPQAELALLAEQKRALLRKIDARREDFADRIEHVLRPVKWADWAYSKWREISPLLKVAAAPPGTGAPHKEKQPAQTGGLFHWAPLALNLFRSMR